MPSLKEIAAVVWSALRVHAARFYLKWIFFLLVCGFLAWCTYVFLLAPPQTFPTGEILTIPSGETVSEIARDLSNENVVQHALVLESILRLMGSGNTIVQGEYLFDHPVSAWTVATRIARGISGITDIKITFPEGQTARAMATVIASKFSSVSPSDFIAAAQPYEGYLFPDTYHFFPNITASAMVATMRANFDSRIATIQPDIASSGHSLSDIVILASIVEREAKTPEDKRIVAGILWNRIRLHIPLQVDAVFGYIYDRPTYSPSYADLATDSPYNTYRHKGLPPGPISNPGLDSLEAAANPTKNNYLYYLTGNDGLMHYAVTYAEHKANLTQYLGRR